MLCQAKIGGDPGCFCMARGTFRTIASMHKHPFVIVHMTIHTGIRHRLWICIVSRPIHPLIRNHKILSHSMATFAIQRFVSPNERVSGFLVWEQIFREALIKLMPSLSSVAGFAGLRYTGQFIQPTFMDVFVATLARFKLQPAESDHFSSR